MVKTTKGGKTMNPTDAYRKDLRKRELKRNKKERKKVREVGILKKDPEQLRDQIQKLDVMKAEGALDKARKHNKRQLEDMLNLVVKKRKLGIIPTLHPDVLPPGISRLPPSPPMPDMHPPPGMFPLIPRPPFGPPPMMRPPLPHGPPPFLQSNDLSVIRPSTAQKPSYVKSAAPTVVKRPLAQHTPELTSMVPASVRVKRQSIMTKPRPKSSSSTTTVTNQPMAPTAIKQESLTTSSSAPKSQSVDDSYMAFLEDMKALGALDS